jgi:hypothetical protein
MPACARLEGWPLARSPLVAVLRDARKRALLRTRLIDAAICSNLENAVPGSVGPSWPLPRRDLRPQIFRGRMLQLCIATT